MRPQLFDIKQFPDRKHGTNHPRGANSKSGLRTSKGKDKSKFEKAHFIAWDGEGLDRTSDGKHVYALFRNNEGHRIINPEGLSTMEVLDFISEVTTDKKAIHVFFASGYDVNMIMEPAGLSKEQIMLFNAGQPIEYGQYRLENQPHKCFTIKVKYPLPSQAFHTKQNGKIEYRYKQTIMMWDVFGFFQQSFLKTLTSFFVDVDPTSPEAEEWRKKIAFIKTGKDIRGTFTKEQLEGFVDEYCAAEVDALRDLMLRLHGYLNELGIKLSRWDGAGAIAAALLKMNGVKPHIVEPDNQAIIEAGEYAYFGGRIETFLYGHYEAPVYHDDIRSAYPDALRRVKSMATGSWRHLDFNEGADWHGIVPGMPEMSLALVSWTAVDEYGEMKASTNIGPFPWRDSKGMVKFPAAGKSWVYQPEILAAFRTMSHKLHVVVHEVWSFFPETNIRPFAYLEDIYKRRAQLKAEHNGAEKPLKVGANSTYGKTVQSIGYKNKSFGSVIKKPPYHNILIGGWVTSYVRGRLLEAAMQDEESIICIATDGIYSTRELKLRRTEELGDWEFTLHNSMTIVQSGIYWYETKGKLKSYFRGFLPDTLSREKILEGWRNHDEFVPCKSRYFMGLGTCLSRNHLEQWGQWYDLPRKLSLSMKGTPKRLDIIKDTANRNPHLGFVKTKSKVVPDIWQAVVDEGFPFGKSSRAMSKKYKFAWDEIDKDTGLNSRQLGVMLHDTSDQVSANEVGE